MAEYQIMYWKNIPAEVRAADVSSELTVPLPPRFQEAIDAVAMQEGLSRAADYSEGWHWGELLVLPGTAEEVARAVLTELEEQYPRHAEEIVNFVLRAREKA